VNRINIRICPNNGYLLVIITIILISGYQPIYRTLGIDYYGVL